MKLRHPGLTWATVGARRKELFLVVCFTNLLLVNWPSWLHLLIVRRTRWESLLPYRAPIRQALALALEFHAVAAHSSAALWAHAIQNAGYYI